MRLGGKMKKIDGQVNFFFAILMVAIFVWIIISLFSGHHDLAAGGSDVTP